MSIPIYVISIARDSDRRANISTRLNASGVEYEIIDAVDGAQLDTTTITDRLRQDKIHARYNRDLLPGEIGCFLSHYNLWQRMVNEQTPFALILEDDATWDDDFFMVVQDLVQSKYYWNVVHLASPEGGRIYSVLDVVGDNRQFARFKYPMDLAAAYLIDLDGAKKLLKHCYEISDPIDEQWKEYMQCNLYFYHVQPAPVNNKSGIANSAIGKRTPEKNKHQLRKEMGKVKYFFVVNRKRYARRWYHWTHPPKMRQQ